MRWCCGHPCLGLRSGPCFRPLSLSRWLVHGSPMWYWWLTGIPLCLGEDRGRDGWRQLETCASLIQPERQHWPQPSPACCRPDHKTPCPCGTLTTHTRWWQGGHCQQRQPSPLSLDTVLSPSEPLAYLLPGSTLLPVCPLRSARTPATGVACLAPWVESSVCSAHDS